MKFTLESSTDMFAIAMAVIIIGSLTFRSDAYSIEPESPDIYWVKKTWWGFQQEYRPIKWFNGAWHTKGKNGEWYVWVTGDDSDTAEHVPIR